MRPLIDMAAERGAFIDQSQSLNLFMETPTIGKLSSMYLHAWKAGLKTTYYLRSRPATRINKTTTPVAPLRPPAAERLASPEEDVHRRRGHRLLASRTPKHARRATDGTHRPDHRPGRPTTACSTPPHSQSPSRATPDRTSSIPAST